MYVLCCYWIFCATILKGSVSAFTFGSTWNGWNAWSACSQTCGDAFEMRSRSCPLLSICRGDESETRSCITECHLDTCPQGSQGAYDCNFEIACPNWSTTFAKGGSTPTNKNGPDYDHTFKRPGCGNFVYLESSNRQSGRLISSKLNTTSDSCLMFYANFHSEDPYDMGTLDVYVRPSAGGNVLLWERDGSYLSRYKEWLPVNIKIPAGTDFQIIFVGKKEHGYRSDLAIDDIQFTPNAKCLKEVDGNWSPWTSYGECSVTCGCGTKTRRRYCDTPERTDDGANCKGPKEDTIPCDEELPQCPVKGYWADWGPWSKCTQDCGIEYQTRTQECSDPIPVGEDEENKCMAVNDDGEINYSLSRMQSRLCNHLECGLDIWSRWSPWSECSAKCKRDKGTKVKTRTCPGTRRVRCVPENKDNMVGNVEIVAKECYGDDRCDSSWGDWLEWSECSITCSDDELDVGTRYKSRTKYLKEPNHLDDSYRKVNTLNEPLETETTSEVCNSTVLCNRGWANWEEWTECSGSCTHKCGGRMGTQTRRRICERSTNDCIPNNIYDYHGQSEIETKICYGDDWCVFPWMDECLYEDNQIGVIANMSMTWSVSIDILLIDRELISTSKTNIIRVGLGQDEAVVGDRLSAIFINENEFTLSIETSIRGDIVYDIYADVLQVDRFVNIEQRQDYHADEDTYYYKIFVNCNLYHMCENTQPQEFENLKIYASESYTEPANVRIRNFVIDSNTTESKHLIQTNYCLLIIPVLAKEWFLQFDFKAYAIRYDYSSIIQAIAWDHFDYTDPGFMIPALDLDFDSLLPIFYNYVSGEPMKVYNHTEEFVLNEWSTIRIEQSKHNDTDYVYSISIDGVVVHSEVQTTAREFAEVKLFACGIDAYPAYGAVKDVRFGMTDDHY